MATRTIDYNYRINIDQMYQFLAGVRPKDIRRAVLFGSETPDNQWLAVYSPTRFDIQRGLMRQKLRQNRWVVEKDRSDRQVEHRSPYQHGLLLIEPYTH